MADRPTHSKLNLTASDRELLNRWIRSPKTPQGLAKRSLIVCLLADGHSSREVARMTGASRPTVLLWQKRFVEAGCDALASDRPGRGRKKKQSR